VECEETHLANLAIRLMQFLQVDGLPANWTKCAGLSELRTLKNLPKTLDKTYKRILLNIDGLYREDVHRVLMWLCFCFYVRPVTLAEMVEVLAVTFEDGPRFDPDERYPEPRDILTRCSSLVSMARCTRPLTPDWR
jgi:hypothetical protein